MTNIKKIIIFVLVLFLILIFRRKRLLENFFDEKYLDSDYMSKDVLHSNQATNIYIEFYYKDTCAISRQFLYGCCKPYNEMVDEENKISGTDKFSVERADETNSEMANNSLYLEDDKRPLHESGDEVQNPRYDETHCMDHEGNKLKSCFYDYNSNTSNIDNNYSFQRTINYNAGDTCMPYDYFTFTDKEGGEKNGCILKENLNGLKKPTFYYLKRFIDYVNYYYNKEVNEKIRDENVFKFEMEHDGEIKYRMYRFHKNDFKFHIHLKIINAKDKIRSKGITLFPLLRVKYLNKIDEAKEIPDNLIYTKHDYTGDVNNLCNVVHFLKDKIKVNITNNDLDFNLSSEIYRRKIQEIQSEFDSIILFESNLPLKLDIEGYDLSGDGVSNVNDIPDSTAPAPPPGGATNLPSKVNLLKYLFEQFKRELGTEFKCPDVSIYLYNANQKYRDADVKLRVDASNNYLSTRPRIYWNNPPIDTEKLLILFQDKDLIEDYGGSAGKQNLVYWFMWNIPKNDIMLEEKKYTEVQNKMSAWDKQYFELYPYQLFDPQKYPQFFNRDLIISGSDDEEEEQRLKEDFLESLINRQLDIKIKIYGINKTNEDTLNNAHQKYGKSNITEFYKKIFDVIQNSIDEKKNGEFIEKRFNLNRTEYDKKYYSLRYNIDKQQYTKLIQYQKNTLKQGLKDYKFLVAKSGMKESYSYSNNKNKTFYFGKESYWVLNFDTPTGDSNVNIDNNKVLLNGSERVSYYIPYKCSKVQVYSDMAGSFTYNESTREIYLYDWYTNITTSKKDIYNLGYGISSLKEKNKFKSYKCYKEETNWLINFSITNNNSDFKLALNNTLILDINADLGITEFNFSYITDSIKTIEFLCEFGNGCNITNVSILPVNSTELDFSTLNLGQGEGFRAIEDEKFLTYQIVKDPKILSVIKFLNDEGDDTFVKDYKLIYGEDSYESLEKTIEKDGNKISVFLKETFKLPKRSNYLLQIPISEDNDSNGNERIKFEIKNNKTGNYNTLNNLNNYYFKVLEEVNEIDFKIQLTMNKDDINELKFPKIYYGKVIEIDTLNSDMLRVLNINHDIFNCRYSSKLPQITWDYFNETKDENINSTINSKFENKLLYGVEVYNAENEDETYYLEWDIKDNKTDGKIFRNTFVDQDKEALPQYNNKYISSNSLTKYIDNNYYSLGTSIGAQKIDTTTSGKAKSVFTINDRNCYLGKVEIGEDGYKLPKELKIISLKIDNDFKVEIFQDELNRIFKLDEKEGKYISKSKLVEIKFNNVLQKWMIWTRASIESKMLIWVGCQEDIGDLFSTKEYNWLLSPRYKGGKFNFYDYPSPADEDIEVSRDDTKLLRVSISMSGKQFVNAIRCDNLEDKEAITRDIRTGAIDNIKNNINKDYGNRFKNTLFRFTNKVNLRQAQDKLEVYEYTDEDNKKNARLVYTLKLKARVSTYCKEQFNSTGSESIFNSSVEDKLFLHDENITQYNSGKIANRKYISVPTNNHTNISRVLSEQVKRTYINNDIINSVIDFIESQATSLVRRNRKSLFNNEVLKSEEDILQDIRYRTFIDIEDCLSEILIYRGNLSKVSQRYLPPGLKQEYQNRLYYSMDEMDEKVLNNESSRPVINDLAEIDKYFVSAYREYVNNSKYKVEHDNFTSYGDLNIYQNETMMIYRIPVDITCPKFNNFFVCDKVDTTDSIILSLKQKYASFLQYYNVMNNILNEVDDYLFSPDSNSLFFTDFLRNLAKNNSISRLTSENGSTFIGNSNIIKLQLQIIDLTLKINTKINSYQVKLTRLERIIISNGGAIREKYKAEQLVLVGELRNEIKVDLVEVINKKTELQNINKEFNKIGINLFTFEENDSEETITPSSTITDTITENDIPEFFLNRYHLETKLKEIFGTQINYFYLDKSSLTLPDDYDTLYKLFKNYGSPGSSPELDPAPALAPAPGPTPTFILSEDLYKPLAVVEYDLMDIFVMNTDIDITTVTTELYKAKSTFIAGLRNSNINELIQNTKNSFDEGNSVCKTRLQIQGELDFIETLKIKYNIFINLIKKYETTSSNNEKLNILRNIVRAVREFKQFQRDDFRIPSESDCSKSPVESYEFPSPSPTYSPSFSDYTRFIPNTIFFNEIFNIVGSPAEDLDLEFSGAPFPSPSSTDFERELMNSDKLLKTLTDFKNTNKDDDYNIVKNNLKTLKSTLVEKESEISENVKQSIETLNQKLTEFDIDIIDMPETINFEDSIIIVLLDRKKIETKEILEEQQESLTKLQKSRDGMEKILDFNDKLEKIVSFLNIMRDITPIINTYSRPFSKVKTHLDSILEELRNPEGIIINTPSGSDNKDELVRKKMILQQNQETIQLLDSLSSEIKSSSDFILEKYSKYFPNMIEENIPDFKSTISSLISGAPAEMLTTQGRTAAQLAALERRKTHLDPRDIAKFYKDMIINVFNQ